MKQSLTALACLLGLLSCSENNTEPKVVDTNFRRREFRPPPKGEVRAIPPHNIHSGGVGPYELGASFQKTLALLPHGPRVELFKAKGVFDYRLMRAENDALVIGVGRRGDVAFVSVLDPDIAKTESGVGVGAGISELVVALGEIQSPLSGNRDERIISFAALPNARFVVESGKVVAALVVPSIEKVAEKDAEAKIVEPSQPSDLKNQPPDIEKRCKAEELADRRAEIAKLARVRGTDVDSMVFACLLSDAGEAVVTEGERVIVLTAGQGELRKIAETRVKGLNFVTVLDSGRERPQLFSLAQHHSSSLREILVAHHHLTTSKISTGWQRVAHSLRARDASWIGSTLDSAEFLVELSAGNGGIVVGGIYLQGQRGVLRHVVPVEAITLPVEYPTVVKKPPPIAPANDAGMADAAAMDSATLE